MEKSEGRWRQQRKSGLKSSEEHREGNDFRNNTLKALTKSQQHRSAVIEDSSGNILTLTESTAILNQWTEYCSDLYNSIQTLAYSRATSPEHKRLKACLCSEKRLRRLSAIREQNISRSGQHSLWATSEWRRDNNSSPDNMPEDMGDEGMVGVDTIVCHTFTMERLPHAM